MKKKLIMKVLIIILVILLLFALSKVYHFVIVKNVFNAITEFQNEENRSYLVSTRIDDDVIFEVKVLLKENVMIHASKSENMDLNKWKDFQNNEQYSFNMKNKEIYKDDIMILDKNTLSNLPTFIEYTSKEDKISLDKIFQVRHIVLTKYENKFCYKIVTKNQVIVIDPNTYLPFYSSFQRVKFNEKNKVKIENTYEFKVGEVTDEDVALPDLSEYTVVE